MADEQRRIADPAGTPDAVPTAPVRAHVTRAAVARPAEGEAAVWLPAALDELLPEEVVTAIERFGRPTLAILGVGLATELVPDAPWLLIIPALIAVGMARLDRRLRFGFAQGIIGYRSELGWPRGVQEEDDVRWRWRPGIARSIR